MGDLGMSAELSIGLQPSCSGGGRQGGDISLRDIFSQSLLESEKKCQRIASHNQRKYTYTPENNRLSLISTRVCDRSLGFGANIFSTYE